MSVMVWIVGVGRQLTKRHIPKEGDFQLPWIRASTEEYRTGLYRNNLHSLEKLSDIQREKN